MLFEVELIPLKDKVLFRSYFRFNFYLGCCSAGYALGWLVAENKDESMPDGPKM
jgi:hypothetical protein